MPNGVENVLSNSFINSFFPPIKLIKSAMLCGTSHLYTQPLFSPYASRAPNPPEVV